FIERASDPRDQFLFSQLALPSTAVAQRIDEREHLVQVRIAQGGRGNRLVQRLERDAALFTFCKRPYGRRLGAGANLAIERRRRVRRRHSTCEFSSLRRKCVLHTVDEE